MTKPKPKTSAPYFYAYGHALEKEQKERLLDCLGIDTYTVEDIKNSEEDERQEIEEERSRSAVIIANIEAYLGSYDGYHQSIDNAPTGADYKSNLQPVCKKAQNILNELCALNQWIVEDLNTRGCDVHKLQIALGDFIDKSDLAIEEKGKVESRGRNTNEALKIVVNALRAIFKKNYQADEYSDKVPYIDPTTLKSKDISGDFNSLSPKEKAELEFIELALEYANISHPLNIRRLYNID